MFGDKYGPMLKLASERLTRNIAFIFVKCLTADGLIVEAGETATNLIRIMSSTERHMVVRAGLFDAYNTRSEG